MALLGGREKQSEKGDGKGKTDGDRCMLKLAVLFKQMKDRNCVCIKSTDVLNRRKLLQVLPCYIKP